MGQTDRGVCGATAGKCCAQSAYHSIQGLVRWVQTRLSLLRHASGLWGAINVTETLAGEDCDFLETLLCWICWNRYVWIGIHKLSAQWKKSCHCSPSSDRIRFGKNWWAQKHTTKHHRGNHYRNVCHGSRSRGREEWRPRYASSDTRVEEVREGENPLSTCLCTTNFATLRLSSAESN